jgi:hypothetical protein
MSIPVDSRRAFEERLQTLQREYRANLPKTVAALEEEVRALGAGWGYGLVAALLGCYVAASRHWGARAPPEPQRAQADAKEPCAVEMEALAAEA